MKYIEMIKRKIPQHLDRRYKLSPTQRGEILSLKDKRSGRATAKEYGVSRTTIARLWFPERVEEERRKNKRTGHGKIDLATTKKRSAIMKKHRYYKQSINEYLI